MDIRTGIVGIKSHPHSQTLLGTGFFVPGGLILTCAHVVEAYPGLQPHCQLEGGTACFEAEVVFSSPKAEYDLLILRPLGDAPHTPLPVASSQNSKGHPFSIFGYPAIAFDGLNGAGTILGWTREKGKDFPVLQLDSDQITHGFSGAPVWDESLKVVVGMLQQGIKQEEIGRPSFALPIEVIQMLYPDLQVGLPAPIGGLPPGSYLPFPRNKLFTGREAALEMLEKSLTAKHAKKTEEKEKNLGDLRALRGSNPPVNVVITQAITGMGGIGKTQLAVEFAYRCGHRFKGVYWLDLRDPDSLDASIALCGAYMGLAYAEQPEQVAHTLNTWINDGPRLLILDNFEAVAQANEVLARFQHPNLRILLTSRRGDWPASLGLQALGLEVFTPQESLEFLGELLEGRTDSQADLERLADHLGHLPLALELAGRYLIKHPRLGIPDYLEQLENVLEHRSMHNWKPELKSATAHDLSLARTFALSWGQVQDENAKKAFILAGFLAPNTAIPLEIFEQALETTQDLCDETLEELFGLGLLRRLEDRSPAIHPLLAEFACRLDAENVHLAALSKALADIANARNHEVDRSGNYALYTPLLPHVRSVAERAESAQFEVASILWNSLGNYNKELADYAGAKTACERALKIDEAALGLNSPEVARDVNNLGLVLHDIGDHARAKIAFERAIEIWRTSFGESHPQVATGINNLGMVLQDLGDHAGAKIAFDRVLVILNESLSPNHFYIAATTNNLGSVLHELGDHAGAKAAFERAIEIWETILNENHPQIATGVNNLGMVLQDLGDHAGAKAAFERALKIDEAAFGPNHPRVARDVNNQGCVLHDLGDLEGARAAFEQALKIDEAVFGPEHPNVAIRVNNLGMVLQDLGDHAGAKAAFERALKIDEAAFGPIHYKIATRVNNLGGVLQTLGDHAGARAAYERALKILRQFLPEGHPKIKIVEGNLQMLKDKLRKSAG